MDNKSKIYLRKSLSPDGRAIIFEPSLVFKVDSLTYHQHNNHTYFIENDVANQFKKYLYLELHEKLHKAMTETALPEMPIYTVLMIIDDCIRAHMHDMDVEVLNTPSYAEIQQSNTDLINECNILRTRLEHSQYLPLMLESKINMLLSLCHGKLRHIKKKIKKLRTQK
jgi:hypothetical protein